MIYVVGGLGDAGSIICRCLERMKRNYVVVDKRLGNELDDYPVNENDMVVIVTPPKYHIGYMEWCMEKNVSCFVEKPMCYRLDELERLDEEWCRKNVYVNLNAAKLGMFKNVKYIRRLMRYPPPKYMKPGDRGVILDLFPHLLSMMIDRIVEICDVEVVKIDGIDVYAKVLCRNESDDLVVMEAGYMVDNVDDEIVVSERLLGRTYRFGRLPEVLWERTLDDFFVGIRNYDRAYYIQEVVEMIYDEVE